MNPQPINLYSRLDTPPARSASAAGRPTRAQSALEITLFVVFGLAIAIAAVSLMASTSAAHRLVPNLVAEGLKNDRVNIVIVTTSNDPGGSTGTDAILLLSIKPSTHALAATAIPSDLWVPLGAYGRRRLGSALAVGKSSGYPGEGPGLTTDTIAKITGQPVHAYLTLDRNDLARAIDAVGGIDVQVHRGVYDYKTRDRFTRGVHHLDGRRALRFAQSPYVVGPSSTRSTHEVRQQEVILALLARATQPGTKTALHVQGESSKTNLTPDQIAVLSSFIAGRQPPRVSLSRCLDAFEVSSIVYSGEAVRPRDGSFDEVRRLIANVFTQS